MHAGTVTNHTERDLDLPENSILRLALLEQIGVKGGYKVHHEGPCIKRDEQRFLVGRFLYKVCLVKCWRRHFACARRLFVGILRMLVNAFFCVGGVGGSVLL